MEGNVKLPTPNLSAARLRACCQGPFYGIEHVVFPKQNSRVLAGATEILAQLGEESAFFEPGNPTNGDSFSMNS